MSRNPAFTPSGPCDVGMSCEAIRNSIDALARNLLCLQWERSPQLTARLCADAAQLADSLRLHDALARARGGLFSCLSEDCPRLSEGVRQLAEQHDTLIVRVGDICRALAAFDPHSQHEGEDAYIRQIARDIAADLSIHQARGNALVLEAYETELGAGD